MKDRHPKLNRPTRFYPPPNHELTGEGHYDRNLKEVKRGMVAILTLQKPPVHAPDHVKEELP